MKFAELTQEVQVTRPLGTHLDIGLTPGRRKMHLQYKDALNIAQLGPSISHLILKLRKGLF